MVFYTLLQRIITRLGLPLLLFLIISTCCFSCGSAKHYTPSPSLSNIRALDLVKEKLPYKVALLIPVDMKKTYIMGESLLRAKLCNIKYKNCKQISGSRYACESPCPRTEIFFPVELGISNVELFQEGLFKLFQIVEIIDASEVSKKDLWDYSLVFEIKNINGIGKLSPIEWRMGVKGNFYIDSSWYNAKVNYLVNIYSPNGTYRNNTIFCSGGGSSLYKALGLIDFTSDLLNIGTFGLFGYIYFPGRDSDTLIYSRAFAQAQERAFGSFIRQLTLDSQFAAFKEAETVRLAAKSNLTTTPSFNDQHAVIPNNLLDAGEHGEVVFNISNSGEGAGFELKLKVTSDNSNAEITSEYNVGNIPPGKTKEIRLPIYGNLSLSDGWENLYIETNEKRGYDAPPVKLKIQTAKLEKPELSITSVEINDDNKGLAKGNGNGIPENEETVELIAFIKNLGQGLARKVKVSLQDINPGIEVIKNSQEIGTINVGEIVKGKIVIRIPRIFNDKELVYRLKVEDFRTGAAEDKREFAMDLGILKPKLEIASFMLNGIKGNTTVSKNQEAELKLFIKNSGKLASYGVTVTLDNSTKGVILKPENRTFIHGTLKAGMETEALRFPLFIQQSAKNGTFHVRIKISQSNFPRVVDELTFTIQESAIQEVVAKGEKLKTSYTYASPAANFPPKIIIDSPFDGDRLTKPEVTLRFRISDDEEIRNVNIFINGVKLVRGIDVQPKTEGKHRQLRKRKKIALLEGANTIQVVAYDNLNEKTEESITVHYTKELGIGIGRTFAIIIGIADYENSGINDLKYTENDAAAIRDFLMSSKGGSVPPKRIKILVGSNATAANIKSAVGDWLPVAANRRNDRVVLFFAGHGVRKRNEGYFIAYDTDPERIVGTSVEMQDISKYIYDVEAKTVIFFSDACHSGAAFEQKFVIRGNRMDGSFLINQFSGEGHITMVSAKSGQESIELPKYRHGLFTYYLLKGLEGEADKMGNGDRKVDIHELYRYVYEHVSEEAKNQNFSQNPKMDSRVDGDIIMSIIQ